MAKSPVIVFRTEAGAGIGGGHAMRCLAVAEALRARGVEAAVAASDETFATAPALARAGLERRPPQVGVADVAVLDGYGIGAEEEAAWRRAGARLAVIDDGLRPHDADLWIDPTPGRAEDDHRRFAPRARVLSGPRHSPMSLAFAREREAALARRAAGGPPRRVLVGFGLTDPGSANLKAIRALSRFSELEIDVIVGGVAPSLSALRRTGVRLHVDASNVAELTAAADLAVGAAGVSSWERCTLGLPAVTLIVADNQRPNAVALAQAGAARVLGAAEAVDEAEIAAAVAELIADASARSAMSRAAAGLCDGRGAERVAQALLDLL